jgi:SAM-dependent methyltransferase
MNIREAHREIWERKLTDIQPPINQSIDRVTWTAELLPAVEVGRLVDIGTGSGAMLARAEMKGYDTAGVDFDQPLIEWLQSEGYEAYCVDLNSGKIPLGGCSADVVTCCDAIEHLVDPIHALREANRILKPGGLILVSTPNVSCWRRVCGVAAGKHPHTSGDKTLLDGGHVGYYGALDLIDLLKSTGFTDVKMEYRNPDPHQDNIALLGGHKWLGFTYQIAIGRKN